MSDYQESVQFTNKGEHPGKLVLNTSDEDPSLYDLGTWRDRIRPAPAQYITVDAKFLHELADYIKENIPEPETLTDANLIHAKSKRSGLTYIFAKIEGTWYSEHGAEFPEEYLLENYDITEVLR